MRFEMKNVGSGSRVKMIEVTWYALAQILSTACVTRGSEVALPASDAIPIDALIVGVYAVPERQIFNLVISHESFDEVREGDLMPSVEPFVLTRFWLSDKPIEELAEAL